MATKTETFVSTLKINRLTKAQFDAITPSNEELYFLTDGQISYNDLLDKPTIGNGTLTIQRNGSTINTFTANATSPVTIDISVPVDVSEIASQTQMASINSGATTALISQITTNKNDITTINNKIPSEATSSNQLADKAFVNSSINAIAAYYITSNVNGDAFATKAALVAGPWYFDGSTRTPTKNDYAIVIADETRSNACCRYSYTGSQWAFQYVVNDTPFTQAQLDAINSTITSSLVTSYSNHIADSSIHVTTTDKSNWNNKVDKVTNTQRAYVTDSSGNQSTLKWTSNAEGSTIMYRNSAGNVSVTTPSADGHAATKKYVDDVDANKVDKTTTANQVYGTDGSGNQTTYSKDSFGKVDDVKVGTNSVVTNKIANLGTMAGESTADWQPKLTAGSGIDITNNTISTENIFIATYGTTSYADVKAAYDAGYVVVVKDTNYSINMYNKLEQYVNDSAFYFSSWNGSEKTTIYLGSQNTWNKWTDTYQKSLTVLPSAEGITGTSTTTRAINAKNIKEIIQGTTLTGIVFTDTNDVTANDSITTAIGKLQANETDLRNNKQDNISDLGTIRSGAAAGATAVQPGDLATVATSGSYNDLQDKPTIGNGTLTIQKNGTTVATFTANQTGNTTANILADVINTDNTTINKNSNDALQAIGVIDKKSGSAIYDWVGTTAEYNALSSYNNNWVYYITDDNNPVLVPAVDYATVNINSGNELYAVGVKNKNTTQTATVNIYDWVGTYEEYNTQQVGVNHPDWICYITDDVNGGEDIYNKQETDALLDEKQDASTALNYNYISNCITYVPQDIKLDLVNGTLILRAGSKLYVPNGVGVFDEVVITNDISSSSGTNNNCLLFYNRTNGYLNLVTESTVYSGTTEPTAPYAWYDITNNVIVRNTGSSTFNYSLPIAKITCNSSSQIVSIDQVFNGFGYIGSHGFVLPGVKGLIPDGRNSDGTLKSIEYTQEEVMVCDLVTGEGTDRQDLIWGIGDCSLSWSSSNIDDNHFIHWGQNGGNVRSYNTRPSQAPQTYTRAYIEDENRWIIAAGDGNYTWGAGSNEETNRFFTLAHYEIQNSKISSMKLHTIAHLVNFNDIDYVIECQKPTSANGYTWYRLYKSGWVEQGGNVTVTGSSESTVNFRIAMSDTNYTSIATACRSLSGSYGTYIPNKTTQSMTVKITVGDSSTTNINWKVEGFAA